MRGLLKPLLLPLLRKDQRTIAIQAERFRISSTSGRAMIAKLGQAFIGGYNAMLEQQSPARVAQLGRQVPRHFRPFFFEGAAMGYLPRGYYSATAVARRAERDLLAMDPAFLFLYYVGLGFWFGFRHGRRPARLEELAEHLDPTYFPLCYDGFGFKVGFFDFPRRAAAVEILARCPVEHRACIYQGFGRALFFVYMDDERGYGNVRHSLPEAHRFDVELGRSLATGFTGIDRPDHLALYIAAARNEQELTARVTGVSWALTARQMNDADYFVECMQRAHPTHRELLERLPLICNSCLADASGYLDWQARTRERATAWVVSRIEWSAHAGRDPAERGV